MRLRREVLDPKSLIQLEAWLSRQANFQQYAPFNPRMPNPHSISNTDVSLRESIRNQILSKSSRKKLVVGRIEGPPEWIMSRVVLVNRLVYSTVEGEVVLIIRKTEF